MDGTTQRSVDRDQLTHGKVGEVDGGEVGEHAGDVGAGEVGEGAIRGGVTKEAAEGLDRRRELEVAATWHQGQ